MNCPEANRLLNAYADGELELQSALAVEAHLSDCPRCRAAMAGMDALRSALTRACEPVPAPARLRKAVQARIAVAAAPPMPKRSLSTWFAAAPGVAALLIAGWLMLAQPWRVQSGASVADGTRVVYHIAASDNVSANLRTLKNHLDAMPGMQVVVVAHSDGIRFLLQGATDTAGQPYVPALRELRGRGVEFRVCANTLTRHQVDADSVVPEAKLVPSGIAEISRLQRREGYSYLRL